MECLPKKTYRSNKIPPFGLEEEHIYYYGLSSIAIDYIKSINTEKASRNCWSSFPENFTDIKMKIINILLRLWRLDDNGVYELSQTQVIYMVDTMWGRKVTSQSTEDNDKVRLFGLLFLEANEEQLLRLAMGVTKRSQFEDQTPTLRGIFELLAIQFNNEQIVVSYSEKSVDVDGTCNLSVSNPLRIRIK